MKALIVSSLILLATVANANQTKVNVTFSGPSVYGQPIKVSLLEQDSNKFRLLLTVFEHHEQNGLSYKTTEIAENLDCEIDELKSVSCATVTAEGEKTKFYSQETDEPRRFRIALEVDDWPFYLGESMVWETR